MVAFTICSNNYLAQAKTTGDSFLQFHPDAKFVIALVDKYADDFDYSVFSNFEIIPVEYLSIDGFDLLNKQYNIIELNTAVKPAYFHYLFKKYQAEKIIYLDPDLIITSRFEELELILNEKNIVLTPHILSPVDDEYTPTDYHTLRGGVFNLGFIALSNYEKVIDFLNWWDDRVRVYGYADFSRSMFYDQLWINYVPCFYDNFHILKHPGYNAANWNLHERFFSVTKTGDFVVNENYPLRFFHFSGYDFFRQQIISKHLSRYNFDSRPDLVPIFKLYNSRLAENNIDTISKLPVFYYPDLNKPAEVPQKRGLLSRTYSRLALTFKVLRKGHV